MPQQYAAEHGFVIVKTDADAAKSGLRERLILDLTTHLH
jgi:hypothetical protein